jgi:hypothetical protein
VTGDPNPPRRPAAETFEQLGFRPRSATRWLAPARLARTTLHTMVAEVAGSFTDRRETLAALDPRAEPIADLDLSGRSELWIDHVADTGDGFSHTYPIAWALAHDELTVEDHPDPLPAGDLLVLGGDEVYPVASDTEYRDRLVGPYRAALPWRPPDAARDAVAIPGNHDWYDGLGAFTRRFCQRRWLGGWRTHQRRSYVAVRLPHHWWLWGIDIALAGLVDQPQIEYFDGIARRAAALAEADGAVARVLIATAKPTWLDDVPGVDPAEHDAALDYLESMVARRRGLEVAAVLSGDTHYYARHVPADRGPQRIVFGGGGAFLHPTDHAPEQLTVERRAWSGHERVEEATLAALWPSKERSSRLRWRALWIGARNGAFPVVTAAAYLLWLLPGPGRTAAAAAAAVALASVARRPSLLRGAVWGVPHAAAHIGVMALAVVVADAAAADGAASVWWRGLSLLLAGAVIAPVVIGLYFVVVGRLAGVNDNEAFSAIRVRQHKGLLRLHLDTSGRLHLHAIGIDDPPPRDGWRLDPQASPDAPWFAPVDGRGPGTRLVDGPVELESAPSSTR